MRLSTSPLAVLTLLTLLVTPALAQSPPAFTTPMGRDNPLVGTIWLPRTGSFGTVEALLEQAQAADAVLLGETHDNADHHALQAWVVGRLVATGKRPLVAFEMIDLGQREALERHLAAHPGDSHGLGAALDWDRSGWPDWQLYRPIAAAALDAGAPLAPANLSREQVRAIGRGDAPPELNQLELDTPLDPILAQGMEHEVKAGHCNMLPDAALPSMVRVQRGRDAVMARTLADGLLTQGSAILIAGASHVRTDRAVPSHLAAMAPAGHSLAIAFLEVRDGRTDPAEYGALFDSARVPFDAIWFTPRAEREDQCEALQRHLDKKKG